MQGLLTGSLLEAAWQSRFEAFLHVSLYDRVRKFFWFLWPLMTVGSMSRRLSENALFFQLIVIFKK